MTIELRKPMVFEVAEDHGDDNDNHRSHFTYRAYSFDDIVELFKRESCADRHSDPDVICNEDMNDSDETSLNVWHELTFTCDSCNGTTFRCKHWETHQEYTDAGMDYIECPYCEECRDCDGNGSISIPLHDTITLEDSYPDNPDVYINGYDLTE